MHFCIYKTALQNKSIDLLQIWIFVFMGSIITQEGWYEVLRGLVKSAEDDELIRRKEILWIYIPDFEKNGTLNTVKKIPNR